MTQHYDAVVIGSGQGGSPLARALAGSGRKTALVEREHVGGTCINWGCTPTKTMIASAKVAQGYKPCHTPAPNTSPFGVQ